MNLEQLTVSLPLAQQLRDAGFEQEGNLFYWTLCSLPGENAIPTWKIGLNFYYSFCNDPLYIAAPTASEILERLPSYFIHPQIKERLFLYIYKDDANLWRIRYGQWGTQIGIQVPKEKSEINVCASMYLYLRKEKLI